MAKKKKLLIYIHQSILKGGVEKVFYNLFNNLPGDEFEVTVLNYVAYLTDDLDSVRYKGQRRRLWFYYDEFSASFIKRQLQRVHNKVIPRLIPLWIRLQRFDVAIAAQEGMYAKFVDEKVRADKKLLWIHNDMLLCRFTEAHFNHSAEEERECYSRFDHVVCVSEDVRKTMVARFGPMDNLCVRYNPIDTKEIDQKLQGSLPERPEEPLFVCVGRLVGQKGFDRLISVCAKLNREGLRYSVWIVGEGADRPQLEQAIEENDLSNVSLLGNQSNPFKYIKQADWLLCTSRYEGFSTVLQEAAYCGVPIITTRNAGAEELLGDSRYGIVLENTTEAILNGMRSVLTSPSLQKRYAAAIQERRAFVDLEERIRAIHRLF